MEERESACLSFKIRVTIHAHDTTSPFALHPSHFPRRQKNRSASIPKMAPVVSINTSRTDGSRDGTNR